MTDYGEFCHEMREWARERRAARQDKNMKKALDRIASINDLLEDIKKK